MKLDELVSFLDETLKVKEWQEKDAGANGLQLVGKPDVKKIAFAVDACEFTIKQAINERADMLFAHHGLMYGKMNLFNEVVCNRMRLALNAYLSVYSAHLSLDAVDELGHNDQMLKAIGAKKKRRFDEDVGAYGTIVTTRKQLIQKLSSITGTSPKVLAFGPEKIKCVGVVTGSGAKALQYLPAQADTMITGVYDDGMNETAKEMKVNVLCGGHIATEELGLKAVAKLLEKKGLKTVFIKV